MIGICSPSYPSPFLAKIPSLEEESHRVQGEERPLFVVGRLREGGAK